MLVIKCKNCGERIKVNRSSAGRQCRCPRCNALVDVASAQESETQTADPRPFAEAASDELQFNAADGISLSETDILPAIEEEVVSHKTDFGKGESWAKRLEASYQRSAKKNHAKKGSRQTVAILVLVFLAAAILAGMVFMLMKH